MPLRTPPSISSSSSSIAGALAGVGRQITGNKSEISIHIDNHYAAKVYTSGTTVAGHVTVVNPGPKDLRFDHMQITLHGFTKTRVHGTRGPQEGKHQFLELHMPIADESYPVPRVYEADQTYSVPFTFVIPENLVLGPCQHRGDISVQEQHRALPPSMGHWQKDDMAPEMARVNYVIMAHVFRESEYEENRVKKKKTDSLLKTTQPINVLPAFPEQPPLGITKHDKEYAMTKSKPIKKTILSPKSGELTVTATQPAAVMLSSDGRAARTTTVPLTFRFDPATTQSATPKILHVGRKLTAFTYFSLAGIGDMPNMGDWVKTYGVESRGAYESFVGLTELSAKHVEWKQDLHPRSRRDSGYGSEEHATSGSNTSGGSRQTTSSPFSYSATLHVPIELPVETKAFLPTFHSCRTSRVYILTLQVAVSSGSSNSTTLTLKVPLQIGVESARQPALGVPPSFEAAVEEAAIEGPSQNRGELPGYSESR